VVQSWDGSKTGLNGHRGVFNPQARGRVGLDGAAATAWGIYAPAPSVLRIRTVNPLIVQGDCVYPISRH
jgi:hypothetical protein